MYYKFFEGTIYFIFSIVLVVIASVVISRSIEYIENNIYAAKSKIQNFIYIIAFTQLILLWYGIGLIHFLYNILLIYLFNSLMPMYPRIEFDNIYFISGLLGTVINHFWLVKFFVEKNPRLIIMLLSFVLIWAIPMTFFFTLNASEDLLFAQNRTDRPKIKTYAGRLKDYLMNIGRNRSSRYN